MKKLLVNVLMLLGCIAFFGGITWLAAFIETI